MRPTLRRGFTLVEVMIVTVIMSILMLATFSLMNAGQATYQEGTVRQLANFQAQNVLDTVAEDFRNAAAWDFFRVSNAAAAGPGSGGDTVVRLTKFWGANKLTRGNPGAAPPSTTFTGTKTSPFYWAALDASTDAVAFLRVRQARVPSVTTSGYPAYLILDFEPMQPSTWVIGDTGANGANVADSQPGRMDDDPQRSYILYRTRVESTASHAKHLVIERVRSIAAIQNDTVDSAFTATPLAGVDTETQQVLPIGDLGPADQNAFPTIGGIQQTPGKLEIEADDTGNTVNGAGVIRIHVVAKGIVEGRGARIADVVVADLETRVSIPAATPPY